MTGVKELSLQEISTELDKYTAWLMSSESSKNIGARMELLHQELVRRVLASIYDKTEEN